jgi:hypothetical protein
MTNRGRRALLAGVCVTLAVACGLAISASDTGASPKLIAVRQLLTAARARDEAAVDRLLAPSALLGVYSDYFLTAPSAELLREFLGPCRPVEESEAMGAVAVRFDCARDARGEFILDFAFCRNRVSSITWPESGRRFLSPLPRQIWPALRRRLGIDPDPCSG